MIRTSLIVIAATFLIAFFVFQDRTERRVALLLSVTNNGYHHSDEYFHTSTPDLAITLSRLGFEVIESISPDRKTMVSRMQEFVEKLKTADVALVYFSGEVAQFSGRSYLVPTDMKANRPWLFETYGVPLDPLLHEMGRKVHHSFIFLNACRLTWRHFDRRCYGLAPIGASSNIIVAHANQVDNKKYPHKRNEAAFVQALVTNLEKGGLPVQRLLKNIHADVKEQTQAGQTPWVENAEGKSFVFNNTKAVPFKKWSSTPPKVASIIPLSFYRAKVEPPKPVVKVKAVPEVKPKLVTVRPVEPKEVRMDLKTAISVMQKRLADMGCYRGKVDGIWGRLSRRAVRKFEKHTGKVFNGQKPDVKLYRAVSEYSGPVCRRLCKGDRACHNVKRSDIAYIPVIISSEGDEKLVKPVRVRKSKVRRKKYAHSKRKARSRHVRKYKKKRVRRRVAKRYVRRSVKRRYNRRSSSRKRVYRGNVWASLAD